MHFYCAKLPVTRNQDGRALTTPGAEDVKRTRVENITAFQLSQLPVNLHTGKGWYTLRTADSNCRRLVFDRHYSGN